ncbi:MAG: hypothetical protein ACI4J5_06535 [Oscillospiraceae bacterium]
MYRIKTVNDVRSTDSPLTYSGINKAAELVKRNINSLPGAADMIDKFRTSGAYEYVANLTKEELEKIEKGEIKLGDSSKEPGAKFPAIYEPGSKGNKKYVTLSKKQLPSDFLSSVNSFVMQRELNRISQELIVINTKLDFIERGQRNDRIALVLAARQQFIEALCIENDPFLQKSLFSQAITTANSARFQLHTSLNSDIESLLDLSKSSSNKKKVNTLSLNIRESLTYINVSAMISAKSYAAMEQQKAYKETLKSYKALLEETFYESKFKDATYAQALYDNWDVTRYGNSIDWRTLPENIINKISSAVNDSDLIQIDLNELYGLSEDGGKVVLEVKNGDSEDDGQVVIRIEQEM